MIAKDLIDTNIATLNAGDSVERAIQIMNDLKINQLPFVNNHQFEGLFSEDLLLNFDLDLELSQIPVIKEDIHLSPFTPILEVIKSFENAQTEILPVIDNHENFEGIIEKKHAYESFVLQMSLNEPGGIIEINVKNNDYSLTEISRIVENENAKIVCLYLSNVKNQLTQNTLLTIKLDISQISTVVNALGRYGYEVSSYHSTEPVANLEKDRYEMLMKYLSI